MDKRKILFPEVMSSLFWIAIILFLTFRIATSREFQFQHLTIEDGLSQSSVYCIIQDSLGFLWIGTEDGLNLYDGYGFKIFRYDPEDSTSIGNNSINAIQDDHDGNLWIATSDGGLNIFNRKTERFKRLTHVPADSTSISDNYVSTILISKSGEIWVGTYSGLEKYDPQTESFLHFTHNDRDSSSILFGSINALAEDHSGAVWVGTWYGLDRLDPSTGKFTHYVHDSTNINSIRSDEVFSLFRSMDNLVWIGTTKGLDCLNPENGQITHINLKDDPTNSRFDDIVVNTIFEDSNGILWIGTERGIFRLDREKGEMIRINSNPDNPNSLNDNEIFSITEDACGIIWFGTGSGGINKYDPNGRKFEHFTFSPGKKLSLTDKSVFSIFSDSKKILWVGTEFGGLNRIDRQNKTVKSFINNPEDGTSISSNFISAIYKDSKGVLWVGTDNGLNRYDSTTGKFKRYQYDEHDSSGIGGNVVFSLLEDSSGNLWIGLYGDGLSRFDKTRESFTRYYHKEGDTLSIGSDFVNIIARGSDNTLWIGTDGDGLNRYYISSGIFRKYPEFIDNSLHLTSGQILALYEDSSMVLWIGTFGGGLNRLDLVSGELKFYTDREGLPNNTIYGILPGGKYLWMSTNKGLVRFNPQTETFHTFTRLDGLQSDEFNQGAFFKADWGEMFFGGINGVNAFYPEKITLNSCVPNLVFTDFRLFDTSLSPGESSPLKESIHFAREINLSYKQNYLSFSFAALSFFIPENNQYSYKLEGFDEKWSPASPKHEATYMNLSPGEYTFKVKGASKDGMWNREPLSFTIRISPPFWATIWFRLFLIAFIGGAIYTGIKWRITSIQKQKENLEIQIGERTKELHEEKIETEKINARLRETNELLNSEIQKRVKAEAELRESEQKYRSIVDSAFDGIYLLRGDHYLYVNPRLCEMTGYSEEELTQTFNYDIIFPEEIKPLLRERYEKRCKGIDIPPQYSAVILKKNGERIDVNIVSSLIRGGSDPVVIGIIRDMSEIKNLENQLIRAQKMEAIGQLAGGIAHDFNNILAVISGYSDLMLFEFADNPVIREKIMEIKNAVKRAANLVQQLLAYSRKQLIQPKIVDLNSIIEESKEMLTRLISEDISLQFHLADNLKPILADPGQIEQILINLVINARDAIMEHPVSNRDKRIIVKTGFIPLAKIPKEKYMIEHDKDFVFIDVIDTGAGMEETTIERIFDPFFTTKGWEKGTGLGLSTVYGIVKQNNGEIFVSSKLNEGSRFRILWEVTKDQPVTVENGNETSDFKSGNETILLVEDDEAVMKTISRILEGLGYRVLKASSASGAMELVNEYMYKIDLLFTDVVMPEMTGKELYEKISRLNPRIAVVFSSGYDKDILSKAGVIPENIHFIYKPYSMKIVSEVVREALDSKK